VPIITDPKLALKAPELAVLSAMAHGKGNVKIAVRVAFAAAKAAARVPNPEDAMLYYELVVTSLSPAARKAFEMLPAGYQFKTPLIRESIKVGEAKGIAKGRAEGRVEGRAEGRVEGRAEGQVAGQAISVLEVFKARKLTVSAEQRKKILACQDRRQLATWLRRALTVASVKELFTH
jgi:flagellar biosynthesis/type III secretory pathway protein FliH